MSRTTAGAVWSREQLEQILGALSDAVTVQDAAGEVVFANREALRMMFFDDSGDEQPAGDVINRFEVLDEHGNPFPLEELPGRRLLRGEPASEVVVRYRPAEGGPERWSRVSSKPIIGADGRIEFAVNTFRDVTATRVAEQQLRFQAELLNEVDAAILAVDEDGAIVYHNRDADRLFGWPAGERPAATLSDLLGPPPLEPPAPPESPAPVDASGSLEPPVPLEPHISAEGLANPDLSAVNVTDGAAVPENGSHPAPAGSDRRDDPLAVALRDGRWEGEVGARSHSGELLPMYGGVSATRDASGQIVGATVALFDLRERRRIEAALRMSEQRYRTLAESLPHIVWTARPDGHVDHYNDRYAEYTGVPGEHAAGWNWTDHVHPEDLPGLMRQWENALHTGRDYETEYRLRRADGAYRWHMGRAVPLRGQSDEIVGWIGTSTDIDDRKRAERGLQFLAEASEVLNTSLDYEETLASVARLAVPRVADWCRVDLLDEDGRPEMVAIAHVDPAKVELAREVNRRWPPNLNDQAGLPGALRTGRSELIEDIAGEMVTAAIEDPELLEIMRRIGLRSSMIAPLMSDGRAIGAISFVAAESGRRFDRTDLALAEDLARRATVAIENALLYRRISQFKGAVDNSTDCVFMFDPETLRFTYVNRGAVEQVGYTAEELLRMTPLELKPEFSEASYREMLAPLVSGELASRSFETVQRRKDGVLIPVDVVLQRIPIEPGGLRVIAFVRDVTERVETQARLRRLAQAERTRAAELDAVIRAMGEALVVFDSDGLVTLSNPAADALFADALISRWDDVVAAFEATDGKMPKLGLERQQGPVELRLRGRRRWIELTTYPVMIDSGTSEGPRGGGVMILVMRDVTAQREDEAMREAFVGVLSHELRTPVTTIYGSAKVLERVQDRISDKARNEIYGDIAAESERLYRLVEDLLVLARFGEEPMALGDEPVLLQRLLPPALASEQSRWPQTVFVADIPNRVPTVRADATYVEQVVRNLLSNAAKYGPRSGRVSVKLEPAGDEVLTIVRDSGPGFPEEEAGRLFELFYRSPMTAGSAPGAGIGLFVCRRLIEAMGGRVWARNLPEGGAEFGFALQRFVEEA